MVMEKKLLIQIIELQTVVEKELLVLLILQEMVISHRRSPFLRGMKF